MFWHADTDGFDITADMKLPGCTLISAREMIAHQELGVQYCHKHTGAGQTRRIITRNIIPGLLLRGFGKTLAKLCFGVVISFPTWCNGLFGITISCINVIKWISIGTSTKGVSGHPLLSCSWSNLQLSVIYYQSWTWISAFAWETHLSWSSTLKQQLFKVFILINSSSAIASLFQIYWLIFNMLMWHFTPFK